MSKAKSSSIEHQDFPPDDFNQDSTKDVGQDSYDEFNQDAPDDFSQESNSEYSQDSGYDDTVQYEMPSATQAEKRPTPSHKKRK